MGKKTSAAAGQPPVGRGTPKKRLAGADGHGAKAYTPTIATRSIDGNITRTRDAVMAWYRLAPKPWSFRSDSERWGVITHVAGQYAELGGRWLHIRVTNRPYPISAWAEAHIRNAQDVPQDIPGALSWRDYTIGEQQQLINRVMYDKEIYLGVEVQRRNLYDNLIEGGRPVLKRIAPALLDAELKALDTEITHLDQVIGSAGLDGRPVTAAEMRWLMHRSCNLGMPAPQTPQPVGTGFWAPEDLAAITEGSDMYQEDPYAPTVTVRGRAGTMADVERHVAVLSMGVQQPLLIPEEKPWMQWADDLGIPLEWSARIYVRDGAEVQHELTRNISKVRSQVKHFEDEHDLEAPQELERQASQARQIEDQINGQWGVQNARVKGWWRVAVSGPTREQALNNARQVLDAYKPKIAIEHPEAQYKMAREFIPGEPLASTSYVRRGSVTWAAAALPTATASVGDRRGILLGETTGMSKNPVAWDPWMAQEIRDGSGLTAIVAGLGGGKSFLGAGIVYKTLRTGARWTILDPSGPLARLAELPEIRPYARVINLLSAENGILNPYQVVPRPIPQNYSNDQPGQREFMNDVKEADATRRRLCEDVLVGVLPFEIARDAHTRIVLKRAVRAVGDGPRLHPGMVIDALQKDPSEYGGHARAVYEFLDDTRERLRLLIPEDGHDPYEHARDDRLTILTMPGLTLPKDGVSREHWTDAEALGVELLSLAAWLTQHNTYTGPANYAQRTGRAWRHARKGVWIDEAFFLSEIPAGIALMKRLARDSRKWNARVLLSSQVPVDFLKMQGFVSLLDSTFVGRLTDDEVQSDALRLLGIERGIGYEKVLESLAPPVQTALAEAGSGPRRDVSPRQFLFKDGAGSRGSIERIRIDFSGPHLDHLRTVLDTTPGSTQTPPPPIQAHLDHRTGGIREGAHVALRRGEDQGENRALELVYGSTPEPTARLNGTTPATTKGTP